tara:strand:+ start:543 stop:788 length:246 start_codon:yes stop_codon:yes gene_type:complete
MAETQRIFELQLLLPGDSGVGSSVFCQFSAKKGDRLVVSAWCWRCQWDNLIDGEKNGVFSAYFLLDSGDNGDASCLVQLLM